MQFRDLLSLSHLPCIYVNQRTWHWPFLRFLLAACAWLGLSKKKRKEGNIEQETYTQVLICDILERLGRAGNWEKRKQVVKRGHGCFVRACKRFSYGLRWQRVDIEQRFRAWINRIFSNFLFFYLNIRPILSAYYQVSVTHQYNWASTSQRVSIWEVFRVTIWSVKLCTVLFLVQSFTSFFFSFHIQFNWPTFFFSVKVTDGNVYGLHGLGKNRE